MYNGTSGPFLTIVSFNAEGLSRSKEDILALICSEQKIDVLCLQETHRDKDSARPRIQGMTLVAEIPHKAYGSAMFTRSDITITSTDTKQQDDIEFITVELSNCTVSSIYKPPSRDLSFEPTNNLHAQKIQFVVGDFNCHSTSWGYDNTDPNGHKLEEWAETNNLSLLHDHKLPHSFNSRAWRRGYNPDLCFVTSRVSAECERVVYDPIPRSQHRPIGIKVYSAVKTHVIPYRRRFNFRKARWNAFAEDLDQAVAEIPPTPQNYDRFVQCLREVSCKHIPRGCRQRYIPGVTTEMKDALAEYQQCYEEDPFNDDTIALGEQIMRMTSEARQAKWIETLEGMDMTHSSKIAWNLLKKLSGDKGTTPHFGKVTANQVAHRLLLNGKTEGRAKKFKMEQQEQPDPKLLEESIQMDELEKAITQLKNGKAAGEDDICTEQIKQFGPGTKNWLLNLFNSCLSSLSLPKVWRKAKVIALLKPGKPADSDSSYRPISLLCHLFKLYERVIFQRIVQFFEGRLIPQQAGFRPGKSCTSQILNLTEQIENGFEEGVVTGMALIDLTAAYDTVNHNLLLSRVYKMTGDKHLTGTIRTLLQNRRFYVCLNGKKSRWRIQKNGLPQGSVLAPLLFNVYTNDQPITPNALHFLYADDLAILVKDRSFEGVEQGLTHALEEISTYYKESHLKPNPGKTQVCAFHLRSREARRRLNVTWEGKALEHTNSPKYLGVTLDRTLTYKQHCQNTSSKVNSRNNIIRKLCSSQWGANPSVLLTSGRALCFSVGEYACPVWCRSAHTKKVDTSLNETCRIATGCMKPTPIDKLYRAAGMNTPKIRRANHEYLERFKQTFDERHVMYGQLEPSRSRLKSRRSFMRFTQPEPPDWYPLRDPETTGTSLPWKSWRALNRIRTGVASVKTNLARWGYLAEDDIYCDCGEAQDIDHLTQCPLCPVHCTDDDLWRGNAPSEDLAHFWAGKI